MNIDGKIKNMRRLGKANKILGWILATPGLVLAGTVAAMWVMGEVGDEAILMFLLFLLLAAPGCAGITAAGSMNKRCDCAQLQFTEENLEKNYNNDVEYYYKSQFKGLFRANILCLFSPVAWAAILLLMMIVMD